MTINDATSFARKMIHEVATEMGLCHQTSEDKKSIRIWIKVSVPIPVDEEK
jgi:hypothetical protein